MLNCIILTKDKEKPENFSNLTKMCNLKGINVRKYDNKKFHFVLEETGQTKFGVVIL